MVRRYRRRRYYPITRSLKTQKYSNETYAYGGSALFSSDTTYNISFIPSTTLLGTRKVKNFTLTLVSQPLVPFLFALVYVPEGTDPSDLKISNTASVSIYEPNQNVILSGLFGGPNSDVYRFKSRLARNLNSGDSIQFLMKPLANYTTAAPVVVVLNYAISF